MVDQPTSQRQPRNAGNQLPPGFSGPPPPSSAPPPPPMATSTGVSGSLDNAPNVGAIETGNSAPGSIWGDENAKRFMIALLTINGAFVMGALTVLFLYVLRRRGAGGAPRVRQEISVAQFAPLHDEKPDYYDPYDPHRSPSPLTPAKQ